LPLTLIVTGQHASLEPEEFGLRDFTEERLGCDGREDPHEHVRAVSAALLPRLARGPELVIVQGDTSSALGGALAAFTAGVPVAHVEAGLRTHDPALPWPEEEYRTAIDAHAELLLAPTAIAAANLRAELVRGEVHITGNTGIDALLAVEKGLPHRIPRARGKPRILVTCHRRESWREGVESIATAVAELASEDGAELSVVLHPNPHLAGRMRDLLAGCLGVKLLEPCSHRELLGRMLGADLVLSDSGGIQEEAPALGVPLLVLREKTERPEGIASGCARLVGTSSERIVAEVRRLLNDPAALASMSRPTLPYGDGRAAPRVATIVQDWLKRRELPLPGVRPARVS
jgi:UDP-N-acetylglucosamine 2-epimerase (non-hydrolysing)